jgi:hypothetical protein
LWSIIRNSGYRGYIPSEMLSVQGEDYNPQTRVAEFLKELRKALQETE